MSLSRRDFIRMGPAALLASSALANDSSGSTASSADPSSVVIPKRSFGRHSDQLTVVGFGGHTLYLSGSQTEANAIVSRAIDLGVNFFENAWDYHSGEAESYMGNALEGKRDKVFLMSKFCIYHSSRYPSNKDGAMKMLEDSLRRLKTDHLDLWMLHDVKAGDEQKAYASGGAIEALEYAQKQGKVRYTGFTGHTSAEVHARLIQGGFPWDATLMPVSVMGAMRSREFERMLMPLCAEKKIAVLGMKGFGGSRRTHLHSKTTVGTILRYSLSYPEVCTHVIGVDKLEYVDQAVLGSALKPMSPTERDAQSYRFDPLSEEYIATVRQGEHHYGTGRAEAENPPA